eukprot:TRINITY_DN9630_c0_g1_i1.p1 TRINITY_DN9630_c0_g1~~TRINITY_DN9630_c0_g1_i1.p1  ORF type:complete len:983 (-),score=191.68 TRINITY_DN9630_c0_g1_i1:56-2884(-)
MAFDKGASADALSKLRARLTGGPILRSPREACGARWLQKPLAGVLSANSTATLSSSFSSSRAGFPVKPPPPRSFAPTVPPRPQSSSRRVVVAQGRRKQPCTSGTRDAPTSGVAALPPLAPCRGPVLLASVRRPETFGMANHCLGQSMENENAEAGQIDESELLHLREQLGQHAGVWRGNLDSTVKNYDEEKAGVALHRLQCQKSARRRCRERASRFKAVREKRAAIAELRWRLEHDSLQGDDNSHGQCFENVGAHRQLNSKASGKPRAPTPVTLSITAANVAVGGLLDAIRRRTGRHVVMEDSDEKDADDQEGPHRGNRVGSINRTGDSSGVSGGVARRVSGSVSGGVARRVSGSVSGGVARRASGNEGTIGGKDDDGGNNGRPRRKTSDDTPKSCSSTQDGSLGTKRKGKRAYRVKNLSKKRVEQAKLKKAATSANLVEQRAELVQFMAFAFSGAFSNMNAAQGPELTRADTSTKPAVETFVEVEEFPEPVRRAFDKRAVDGSLDQSNAMASLRSLGLGGYSHIERTEILRCIRLNTEGLEEGLNLETFAYELVPTVRAKLAEINAPALEELFRQFDANNDGYLSIFETVLGLVHAGVLLDEDNMMKALFDVAPHLLASAWSFEGGTVTTANGIVDCDAFKFLVGAVQERIHTCRALHADVLVGELGIDNEVVELFGDGLVDLHKAYELAASREGCIEVHPKSVPWLARSVGMLPREVRLQERLRILAVEARSDNGNLSFKGFLDVLMRLHDSRCSAAIAPLDRGRTEVAATLSVEECVVALRRFGLTVDSPEDELEVQAIFEEFDMDRAGFIYRNDFASVVYFVRDGWFRAQRLREARLLAPLGISRQRLEDLRDAFWAVDPKLVDVVEAAKLRPALEAVDGHIDDEQWFHIAEESCLNLEPGAKYDFVSFARLSHEAQRRVPFHERGLREHREGFLRLT